MGRPDCGRPVEPLVPHYLHDDGDAVDGDRGEGIQHGLPTKPKVQAEPVEHELADPLGFCWQVPLSWVHNLSSVLALYQDQLDAHTYDKVIIY